MSQFLTRKEYSETALVTAFTAEGNRYYAEFDLNFAAGQTRYFYYKMPNTDMVIALIKRVFKSANGACELSILWNSTGVIAGTPIYILNENRNSSKISGVHISEIAAPTTDGLVIETDFLTETGQGNNSSGDLSPDTGFRIYSPDSFFIAKVTNLHNGANRIRIAYNFATIPLNSLG